MLSPDDRRIYLEALRPPSGYALDRAIATTYSLDLTTLLVAPLAFALYGCEDKSIAMLNPTALLDATRQNADRISVFCQEGQIAAPAHAHLLFGLLETSVVQVPRPHPDGVFHPKTWFLRFTRREGKGPDVAYRFLCLSRNLTFDRSWDTALTLEGPLTDRANAFGHLNPLGDFVAALTTLGGAAVSERIRADVERVQHEVRRVQFSAPEGFEDAFTVWPLGIPGHRRWPFGGRIDRMLVVSPFLSGHSLRALSSPGRGDVLVGRDIELDRVAVEASHGEKADSPLVAYDGSIYVLSEHAGRPDPVEGDANSAEDVASELSAPLSPDAADDIAARSGLHAKLYIAKEGGTARLWTGSANATHAALPAPPGASVLGVWGRNVELLVELRGRWSKVGFDALLDTADPNGLVRLLQPWRPTSPDPDAERTQELEHRLDGLVDSVVAAGFRIQVAVANDDRFELSLHVGPGGVLPTVASGDHMDCWPVTLERSHAQRVDSAISGEVCRFTLQTSASVTRFMAFEARVRDGELSQTRRFVLKLPLEGMPEGRDDAILRTILSDRRSVLRYLMMLLAAGDADAFGVATGLLILAAESESKICPPAVNESMPLLEELVRALARRPDQLRRIADFVAPMLREEATRSLLPEGFESVWSAIELARQADDGNAAPERRR